MTNCQYFDTWHNKLPIPSLKMAAKVDCGRAQMCRNCRTVFSDASSSNECRVHPKEYVCRYHPNESAGCGDGLGYYGGPEHEGWPAKFWDCCGNEDPNSAGCTFQKHISFDSL